MTAMPSAAGDLLRKQPQMFRRMVAFNTQPASYLHASRRNTLGLPRVDEGVWDEPRSQPFVSNWILQHLGLTDRWCLDPACDVWPLVLLPAPAFDSLARHVAAVKARS